MPQRITPGTPVEDTDSDDPEPYLYVVGISDKTAEECVVDYTWDMEEISLYEYDDTNKQYPPDSTVIEAVYINKIEASDTVSLEDGLEAIREGPFKIWAFPEPRLEPL